MSLQKRNPWMISPQRFVKLLGAEYDLMQQAGGGVVGRFYVASICVVITLLLIVISVWYAIDLLLHDLPAEILLSVFFAVLFGCIYVFLINTFSKVRRATTRSLFNLSNIIRVSFVVFIAYLMAQPLAIAALGDRLERRTNAYKQRVLQDHLSRIHLFYLSDLNKLQQRAAYFQQQKDSFDTHQFDLELASVRDAIRSIEDKENFMAAEANRKVEGSSFFLYRIQMAPRYFQSWLLTLIIVLFFVFPGFLIYSISADDAYYALKKTYEHDIIVQGRQAFEWQYRDIFRKEYGATVELFSRFQDPPFNQIRKIPTSAGTMDEFLKKFITAAD